MPKQAGFLRASDSNCGVNYEPVGHSTDSRPAEKPRLELPRVAWRGQASIVDRFWSKVEKTPTCWLWRGLILSHGYGQISLGHPSSPGGKRWRTHRFSWELHHGPIPDGMMVCHQCDVPACVNPHHLFLGSQKLNVHDAARKGRRNAFGQQKLNADDVRVIRSQAERGIASKDIAQAFGVSPHTVRGIVRRETWAWVDQQC